MNESFVPDGDPPIDDVRRARHELSARFNHDPGRLIAYLIGRQQRNPEGLISFEDDEPVAAPDVIPTTGSNTGVAVSSGA